MKTIFRIFLRDLRRMGRNPMALIVAVGVAVIPALYAWFNIAANWDPYGSTKGIQVAVSNDDKGCSIEDTIDLDVGKEIVTNLKANDQIGWQFTDTQDAIDGVKSGKYYAAVVIPEDFSQKMSSILSADVESPRIKYYINEKKNAIAPKITDKGVSVIQQQVNSTFITVATETVSKVLKTVSDKVGDQRAQTADGLLSALSQSDGDLQELDMALSALIDTLDIAENLVQSTRLSLPDVDQLLRQGGTSASGAQETITASRETAKALVEATDGLLGSAQSLHNSIAGSARLTFREIQTDANDAANKLTELKQISQSIIDINTRTSAMLSRLAGQFPPAQPQIGQLLQLLARGTEQQKKIMDWVDRAAADIRSTGDLPIEMQNEMWDLLGEGDGIINSTRDTYDQTVKPPLNQALDSLYRSLDSMGILLGTADGSLGNLREILNRMDDSVSSGKKAMLGTRELIANTRDKIHSITAQLNALGSDERADKLLEIIRNDPAVMGSFMASPVQIDTEALYPIENYGSAMAPFYSTLALWVGGIVLVAILKVRVDEDDKLRSIKPHQAYLGRYLIFLLLGLVQSSIICLGDLYFLHIQCQNPMLFLLAGWVSSLVYTNIIYTLTVSFGNIGKALCVVLLVIQIAGAGGTFPIEVTPKFFQDVYPFLPFTYGINAMRETVASIYGNSYLIDILRLLLYIPFALVLGLFLRKPLIHLNEFFEKRLEDTHLM